MATESKAVTLWEGHRGSHTHFGFYTEEDVVVFRYSGPFDLETSEWIYALGTFMRKDFMQGIQALRAKKACELTGIHGEKLHLALQSTKTIALRLSGGYANNLSIEDLDVTPEMLVLSESSQ